MPFICADNWADASATGWRLVCNLSGVPESDHPHLTQLIAEFGFDCVCIGKRFGADGPEPLQAVSGFALYVRDVESQVDGLQEDITNWDSGHHLTVHQETEEAQGIVDESEQDEQKEYEQESADADDEAG